MARAGAAAGLGGLAITLVVTVGMAAQAPPSLAAARALYVAAEYDDALGVLAGLSVDQLAPEEQATIELYRALCLIATGREAEATSVMEALVSAHPSYHPSGDLPPRVLAQFDEARRQLLPSLAQARYLEAKAAFDRADYLAARAGFAAVLDLFADPALASLDPRAPLAHLPMLADGFRELSEKALEPLPAPPPPARVYSAEDSNVVPPITVRQQIPVFPGPVRSAHDGVIEVVIDQAGAVEAARMLAPIDEAYDTLVIAAAREWQFQPASVDGVPVKFAKKIRVSLVPTR